MVVDTSAVLAILFEESEASTFVQRLAKAEQTSISAASVVESEIVLTRRDHRAMRKQAVTELLREFGILIAPVDREQAWLAAEAYRRYGKGRHPARLNFGDCFSYALAKHLGEPLLFKGDDFALTDVLIA